MSIVKPSSSLLRTEKYNSAIEKALLVLQTKDVPRSVIACWIALGLAGCWQEEEPCIASS